MRLPVPMCVPSLMLCGLLLTGCGSSYQTVPPLIDPSLLVRCQRPVLAPVNGDDNEIGAERIRVAAAYLECEAKMDALATRVEKQANR